MNSMLITGGAGFIGVNAARYFADKGWKITVLDNLSRRGTEDNLRWLREKADVGFELADIRDADAMRRALAAATTSFLARASSASRTYCWM